MAKNDPHYVLCTARSELLTYSSRHNARKGAQRAVVGSSSGEAYILEDCGDHWGLWDGFCGKGEMRAEDLAREAPRLEAALAEVCRAD